MPCVVKAQRETNDEYPCADFNLIKLLHQVTGGKGLKEKRLRQRRALKLQRDDVDSARCVGTLPPDRPVFLVKRDGELCRYGYILRIDVQLD